MKKINLILISLFIFIMVFTIFIAPAQMFAPPLYIYVNSTIGNDSWNGNSPTYTGEFNGPKKTIANAITSMASYGTIEIAAGTYHENLTIICNETLTLNGAGADSTIIDGSGTNRVFDISGTGTININNLTITNGGGQIQDGAGINNYATVKINNCIISNNNDGVGGGIKNNNGSIEIYNSKIINNYGSQGGGAIFNDGGEVIIHYCSIYGNSSGFNAGGIVDVTDTNTVYAQNNWWGSSTGPSGGIADYGNPSIFANGSGDEISGNIYFYPWLASDPFASAASTVEGPVWVRTMPMTCYQVWINDDGNFEFVFWWEYKNNNWVKIYDMEGTEVFSIDMKYGNAKFTADLPDGMYTVKTFHLGETPIQEFIIGKP